MNLSFLRKTTRCIYFKQFAVLFLCALGTVGTYPANAQVKPKKVQMKAVSSYVPSGYLQVGSTMLYYRQTESSIDVQGCYNRMYYGSTYNNGGYKVAMKVNSNSAVSVNCLNGTTNNGITCKPSIEQQGELARVLYTITNSTENDAIISLGVYADVMIGNNDYAPISRRIDTAGNTYGVTMKDGNGAQLCVLFGSGLAGVTSVSDYWFGHYSTNSSEYNMVGNYSAGSNYMQENGSYDSGMGWCWKNRSIPAGSTVVFSYLIGVGEVNLEPNSSFEVTPDDPEGWNDLSRPHKLALEGTYESPAGLDGMIEYAVEDSEEWQPLTEMIPSGSTFNDSIVAMFDATREKHVIRFRTKDNVGNTTLLPSIEYLDVSFLQYSGIVDKTYTGDSVYQEVECVDVENMQITTSRYSNNINAGTASFYIEGVFPYTIGRKACSFKINPAPLTGEIVLSADEFVFNKQEHNPSWSFTNDSYSSLIEGMDYNVLYSNNIYPGTANVTVKGKGNYTSEITKTYVIDKAPLRSDLYSITLPNEDVSYDEKEHEAQSIKSAGVGDVMFTYTKHDDVEILESSPKEEGVYDIYVEIADGEWYYGKPKEFIASFHIYRFDEAEWQSLGLLFAELQQMGTTLEWNMSGGAKNVSTFEELDIKEGHVVGISLANKGLAGLFPTTLVAFTNLENLDLSGNNLAGNLPLTLTAIKMRNSNAFTNLHHLNISKNKYNGNVGILGKCIPNLISLNVSNNKFEDLAPALSSSIIDLDISNQKIDRVVELNLSNLSLSDISTQIPSIILYDQYNQSYKMSLNLLCTKADLPTFNKYDTDEWAMQLKFENNKLSMPYVSRQNVYYGESGDTLNVLNLFDDDSSDGSQFKIKLSFDSGDANFVNGVDATDLQATILYAFGDYRSYPFNFTAADTYKDGNINIQDVVCTVNILLEEDSVDYSNSKARELGKLEMAEIGDIDSEAYLYLSNGKILLHSRIPVASLSIKADGDIKWNLDKFGLLQSAAHGNVVAYSLDGVSLPNSEDIVLGEYTHARIRSISLSDAEAQSISVRYSTNVETNIKSISDSEFGDLHIYDASGYKRSKMKEGINILKNNGTTRKIYK